MGKKQLFCPFLIFFLFGVMLYSSAPDFERKYLQTGPWYPKDQQKLRSNLDLIFQSAKSTLEMKQKIEGIIAPHAGLQYSGPCAASVYRLLTNQTIRRIILIGPSHRFYFRGACVSNFKYNTTPLGKIKVDIAITAKLAKEAHFMINNQYMQYEHSLENHLPFIQYIQKRTDYSIIPILIGEVDYSEIEGIAGSIKKYINKDTLIIVSSDFTHFGKNFRYTPFKKNLRENIKKLDLKIFSYIHNRDIQGLLEFNNIQKPTVCGIKPILILMQLFLNKSCRFKMIDYFNSGDLTRNYDTCVTYASIAIIKNIEFESLNHQEKKIILEMSRYILEHYLEKNPDMDKISSLFFATPTLKEKRGIFVTLKKNGQLRGCIGDLIGQKPLYQGIIEKTLDSAKRDPRFLPVTRKEIKDIKIEISIMTPLQKINNYKKIRLGIDGVIIKKGYRSAVFLPQVATETGWNLDQFLSRLCLKAKMSSQAYQGEGMEFLIFQVQKISE